MGPLTIGSGFVSAGVQGSESDPYTVVWEHADRTWYPTCTCPVEPYCKHAYAVACRVLATCEPASDPFSLRPADDGSRALRWLREAAHPWERQQALWQLLGTRPGAIVELDPGTLNAVLVEPDADLRCWRLARALVERGGGPLPPSLEPYRDRADLAARLADRTRGELLHDLMAWARQRRGGAERRLRLIFRLERAASGSAMVRFEARLTTPRRIDAPRTFYQLQQLRAELRRDPDLLPPEQADMLAWLTDHGAGGADHHFALGGAGVLPSRWLLERVADSPLAAWDEALPDDLARRAGVAPGYPLRLSADAARLVPVYADHDGAARMELRFLWTDGRTRGLEDVIYLRDFVGSATPRPSLVLADGAFSVVAEEPPPQVVERFRACGDISLPPAERARTLAALAPAFPHLGKTVAAHTRFHLVVPLVALDLRDDDWLQVRVFAHAGAGEWRPGHAVPPGDCVFEYTAEGAWTRVEVAADAVFECIGAPAANASTRLPRADLPDDEVWVEAPEPALVEPLVAWLAATPARPGATPGPGGAELTWQDREVGWWMRASRRGLERLVQAWQARPAGVVFFGTDRVRRLLGGGSRVVPLLRIESSGLDWFAVSAEWAAEELALSEADIAMLRSAKTRFVRLPSGWVDREAVVQHDRSADLLADLGLEASDGVQRVTLWQLAGARPESLEALERLGVDPGTRSALREIRERVAAFTGLPRTPPPEGVAATLRPYQAEGIDFLAWTSSLGLGAVLADDMGLGKTVQALAWLEHLREIDPDGGPSLVVAPASVVHNWVREAARFVPGLRVLVLERGRARHALRREIARQDLVVTNYALLRRDVEEWSKVRLRAAILDEAQNVKNPDAAVTRAALALRARHRLALTGTPLENRALDLWSIMSFVNPGYLGSRARFTARFDQADAGPHARALLAARLRPVLLRRLKRDVAPDLPERIEERRDCELTSGQRRLYLTELRRSRALVERLGEDPSGLREHRMHVLAALTRLRQVCCHPALAGGKLALGSGKFASLFELLEPLAAEGHKVLVFSQFVECLRLLAAEMRRREMPYHVLTGETVKRDAVVAAFTEDPRPAVFLISLRAGGTGLNLTAASYVVLFDPWWNPAVEAQAIDRTHRIGQDRTVIAYRLVARGTLEERIWDLQQRKAAMVREVLGEDGFARALTPADLDYLLADAEAE